MAFRSRRNRVIGAFYFCAAVIFLPAELSAQLPIIARAVIALGLLVFFLIGIRMIGTSLVRVSSTAVSFRNKWLKRISIECNQIQNAELGTRFLAYERGFPSIQTQSRGKIDLVFFEQPATRARMTDSSVMKIINAINHAIVVER